MPRSDLVTGVLAAMLAALCLLPLIFAPDPLHINAGARNARPGDHAGYLLGGDSLGRDSLARLGQALRAHLMFCALFGLGTALCMALFNRTRLARVALSPC